MKGPHLCRAHSARRVPEASISRLSRYPIIKTSDYVLPKAGMRSGAQNVQTLANWRASAAQKATYPNRQIMRVGSGSKVASPFQFFFFAVPHGLKVLVGPDGGLRKGR